MIASRTIKDVRGDLIAWARYWKTKEYGKGFSNKANSEVVRELALNAGARSTDKSANSIITPANIESITNDIERLKPEYKKAIRQHYILKNKGKYLSMKELKPLLLKAELALI